MIKEKASSRLIGKNGFSKKKGPKLRGAELSDEELLFLAQKPTNTLQS